MSSEKTEFGQLGFFRPFLVCVLSGGDILSIRPANYNTKQREAVLAYLEEQAGEYVTAAQIMDYFQKNGEMAGRTTIYRQLEKLVQEGKAQKYTFDGVSGARFRYADQPKDRQDLCRLKCEGCGEIIDLHCDEIDHFSRHIFEAHAFQVNDRKTVLYGTCKTCLPK